jgi:hypothetical protein
VHRRPSRGVRPGVDGVAGVCAAEAPLDVGVDGSAQATNWRYSVDGSGSCPAANRSAVRA